MIQDQLRFLQKENTQLKECIKTKDKTIEDQNKAYELMQNQYNNLDSNYQKAQN